MRALWITNRADGVTELTPPLLHLDVFDRWIFITTVVLTSVGFFMAGAIPAPVLGAFVASSFAGEVVLAAKATVLALVRPLAEVREVPRFRRR